MPCRHGAARLASKGITSRQEGQCRTAMSRGRPSARFASHGRTRNELLNETPFMSPAHARVAIAAWVEDYNRERPHSSLGYATPAAFAAELDKQ